MRRRRRRRRVEKEEVLLSSIREDWLRRIRSLILWGFHGKEGRLGRGGGMEEGFHPGRGVSDQIFPGDYVGHLVLVSLWPTIHHFCFNL